MIEAITKKRSALEIATDLAKTRAKAGSHLIDIHKGFPATACHQCIGHKGVIQEEEAQIREIRERNPDKEGLSIIRVVSIDPDGNEREQFIEGFVKSGGSGSIAQRLTVVATYGSLEEVAASWRG